MNKKFAFVVLGAWLTAILACSPPPSVDRITCVVVEAEKLLRCSNPPATLEQSVATQLYLGNYLLSREVPRTTQSISVRLKLTVSGTGEVRITLPSLDGKPSSLSVAAGRPGELLAEVPLTWVPIRNATDNKETGRETYYIPITFEPVNAKKAEGVVLTLEASGLIP